MTEAPERIWARESHSERTNETMVAWDTPSKHPEEQEYIRADLAKPRVKPLAWCDWLSGYKSFSAIGAYVVIPISTTHNNEHVVQYLCPYQESYTVGRFEGAETAKAAAQSDYERRISEALE